MFALKYKGRIGTKRFVELSTARAWLYINVPAHLWTKFTVLRAPI